MTAGGESPPLQNSKNYVRAATRRPQHLRIIKIYTLKTL
jgi:hypothetical protein